MNDLDARELATVVEALRAFSRAGGGVAGRLRGHEMTALADRLEADLPTEPAKTRLKTYRVYLSAIAQTTAEGNLLVDAASAWDASQAAMELCGEGVLSTDVDDAGDIDMTTLNVTEIVELVEAEDVA